jgi:hypothetical protein
VPWAEYLPCIDIRREISGWDSRVCDYVPWSNGNGRDRVTTTFYINDLALGRKGSLLITNSDQVANLQLDFSGGGWRVRFLKTLQICNVYLATIYAVRTWWSPST